MIDKDYTHIIIFIFTYTSFELEIPFDDSIFLPIKFLDWNETTFYRNCPFGRDLSESINQFLLLARL